MMTLYANGSLAMLYLESLRIIRQARAPFIIALNKIDKPGADPDFVKSQLKDEGVRYKCPIYFVQFSYW